MASDITSQNGVKNELGKSKAEYSALDVSYRRLGESVTHLRTDGGTDRPSYRDARTHLKTLSEKHTRKSGKEEGKDGAGRGEVVKRGEKEVERDAGSDGTDCRVLRNLVSRSAFFDHFISSYGQRPI